MLKSVRPATGTTSSELREIRSASEWAGPRVLYIEDSVAQWELLQHHVGSYFELTWVRQSDEVFEALRETDFDIILIDAEFEEGALSGLQIAQYVKGTFEGQLPSIAAGISAQTTSVIFLGEGTTRLTEAALIACGAYALIPTPIDFTKLNFVMTRSFAERLRRISTEAHDAHRESERPRLEAEVATREALRLKAHAETSRLEAEKQAQRALNAIETALELQSETEDAHRDSEFSRQQAELQAEELREVNAQKTSFLKHFCHLFRKDPKGS